MKKLIVLAMVLISALFILIGCSKKNENKAADDRPLIGISKTIAHDALNGVEKGIIDYLEKEGYKVRYDLQNANGEINTASSIAAKFKEDKVDVAVGIGTPVAVAIANAIKDKPVVFSAITDPVIAHLAETKTKGRENITGSVDTIPVKEQIYEFRKIFPFTKLGFIYTSSEANSVSMAAIAEETCKEIGIDFVPATISNSSEIKQAAESIAGRIDAYYVVTDNALVSGVASLISTAAANKIPVFSADIFSSQQGGVLYVSGFDYYKLGLATGEIVADLLKSKKPADIPIRALTDPKEYQTLCDLDTAKKLGIEIPKEFIDNADFIFENGQLRKGKANE